jgi:Glycosyl transferase family 41
MELATNSPSSLPSVQPFHALIYPFSLSEMLEISRKYALKAKMNVALTDTRFVFKEKKREERLKIGYVSSDFGSHPLSQLMQSGEHTGTEKGREIEISNPLLISNFLFLFLVSSVLHSTICGIHHSSLYAAPLLTALPPTLLFFPLPYTSLLYPFLQFSSLLLSVRTFLFFTRSVRSPQSSALRGDLLCPQPH